jgi:hypothetical protein
VDGALLKAVEVIVYVYGRQQPCEFVWNKSSMLMINGLIFHHHQDLKRIQQRHKKKREKERKSVVERNGAALP